MATIILFSVLMTLMTLGASREWNHPVFYLLGLAYVTLHNVLQVRPSGSP